MDFKTMLQNRIVKYIESNGEKPKVDVQSVEVQHFENYMKRFYAESLADPLLIPRFYNKLPAEDEILRQRLREESRALLLKNKGSALVDNNELRELWSILDQHQSFPEEQLMTYADYQRVTVAVSPNIKRYFTAVTFAKLLQGDPKGRISTMSLFNYVMRKVWLQQTRIGITLYDSTGQGFLTEADLENYIIELFPTLPQLQHLDETFSKFYICTAVRKFLFFLDGLRSGKVRILDILACSFLDDLLELRDEELSKEQLEHNWFSTASALRVYGHYLNLDRDHNGMLSRSELAAYGSGTFTEPFLDRVFQTLQTYSKELDYKMYLDLVLALENRSEPQSLAFLFRILDINNQGYLDAFTMNFFFRAIQDQMRAHGAEAVSFEDVKDELFDMVKPKQPNKITLQDLIACGQGETFVNILIEFHRFWAYENREAVSADSSQD